MSLTSALAAHVGALHLVYHVKVTPSEVVADSAPVYPRVLDDLVLAAWHHVDRAFGPQALPLAC